MGVPDMVKETFTPKAVTGGDDQPDGRGVRSLEWVLDPDPRDNTYEVVCALILWEAEGSVRVEQDRRRLGLFAQSAWMTWLRETGFAAPCRID